METGQVLEPSSLNLNPKDPKDYVIRTFEDLLRALREHPEWLEELRKLILTEELIDLPRKFNEFLEKRFTPLEEKVDRIEKDVETLKEDVAVLKEDVAVLKQDVAVLKEDVAVLKQDVAILKEDVAILKQDVSKLKIDVGSLKGDNLERKIREKAPSYFGKIFRRIKLISIYEWAEKSDIALEEGLITSKEREDVLNLDLLLRGKLPSKEKEVLIAVEISFVADERDIKRVLERAEIIYKIYKIETIPVVVFVEIPSDLEEKYSEVLFIKVKD